ncbi:unnamed protein product [Fraxinus pennsylvanica]|uniref:Uncharacterized protein n=1 Tax=Fraxinus pennsylvanica TaxID=56036 RepID=A0AAD2ABY6_9LAMI|nr:unnamed protein product [Fraxinus pennsylvanica]
MGIAQQKRWEELDRIPAEGLLERYANGPQALYELLRCTGIQYGLSKEGRIGVPSWRLDLKIKRQTREVLESLDNLATASSKFASIIWSTSKGGMTLHECIKDLLLIELVASCDELHLFTFAVLPGQ